MNLLIANSTTDSLILHVFFIFPPSTSKATYSLHVILPCTNQQVSPDTAMSKMYLSMELLCNECYLANKIFKLSFSIKVLTSHLATVDSKISHRSHFLITYFLAVPGKELPRVNFVNPIDA